MSLRSLLFLFLFVCFVNVFGFGGDRLSVESNLQQHSKFERSDARH